MHVHPNLHTLIQIRGKSIARLAYTSSPTHMSQQHDVVAQRVHICSNLTVPCTTCTQGNVEGLLPTLVAALDATFQATGFAAPLHALSDASDATEHPSPAADAVLAAFWSAAAIVAPIFQV